MDSFCQVFIGKLKLGRAWACVEHHILGHCTVLCHALPILLHFAAQLVTCAAHLPSHVFSQRTPIMFRVVMPVAAVPQSRGNSDQD